MKRIVFSLLLSGITGLLLIGQVPQAFNYQGVLRDASGQVISEQNVSLRISIVKGSESGDVVYSEIHLKNTGQLGMLNLVVGNGNVISGTIGNIEWGSDSHYLRVEADLEAGTNYEILVETKILSVPYALYAQSSSEATSLTELKVDYTTSQPTCNGEADGAILLSVTGGRPPYSCEWSTGAISNNLENVKGGLYTVTVTDDAGQFVSKQINLYEPQQLVVSFNKNDISCNGLTDGSIYANVNGGNGGYNYDWSNGSTVYSINNLSAGSYTLTVTDNKNCSAIASTGITEPPSLSVTGVETDVNCFDDNNGEVNLTVSGGTEPYYYAWSNGKSTQNISNLTVGNYSINVRDNRNCIVEQNYEILSASSQINISSSKTDLNCKGDSDGNIDITVTGGTAPYTFSWSNGSETEDISELIAGSYSATIIDSNGCISNFSGSITEPSSNISVTSTSNFEFKYEADGTIDLTIDGGIPEYNISWNNGATTKEIADLSSGSYSYEITDANECQINGVVFIDRLENVTDIDGNVYDIVKINDQIWMKENLKTRTFNDGWLITSYFYPNEDESLVELFGILYPMNVVETNKLCPDGWRIPSEYDWGKLFNYLNGSSLAGGPLKETGTEYWLSPNTGATNQSGFSARGAGTTSSSQEFKKKGYFATINRAYIIYYDYNYVGSVSGSPISSVRCIKQ